MTDNSRRMVLACGDQGPGVARCDFTPALSTRAQNECRHPLFSMPIDASRTAKTHHEHECAPNHLHNTSMKQRRIHGIVFGAQSKCQMARNSNTSGLLSSDSIRNHAYKHGLHRDLDASINIWKCRVLRERPSASCLADLPLESISTQTGRCAQALWSHDEKQNIDQERSE